MAGFYRGGPCDGLPVIGEVGDDRICGGVSYKLGADGNYHPGSTGGGPIGTAALGTSGPRGWADLRQAVNTSVPTSVSRARILTRAARHKLTQRRRLR